MRSDQCLCWGEIDRVVGGAGTCRPLPLSPSTERGTFAAFGFASSNSSAPRCPSSARSRPSRFAFLIGQGRTELELNARDGRDRDIFEHSRPARSRDSLYLAQPWPKIRDAL